MPRNNSSRSSGRPLSSSSRSYSQRSGAPSGTRQSSTAAAAAPPAAATQATAQQSRGIGLGTYVAANAASTAMGYVGGSMIMDAVRGTGNRAQTNEANAGSAAPATYTNTVAPCEADFRNFLKCLEDNKNQIGACQGFFNMFESCRSQNE